MPTIDLGFSPCLPFGSTVNSAHNLKWLSFDVVSISLIASLAAVNFSNLYFESFLLLVEVQNWCFSFLNRQ